MQKMLNHSEPECRESANGATIYEDTRWHWSEILFRTALFAALLTYSSVTGDAAVIQSLAALAILLRIG